MNYDSFCMAGAALELTEGSLHSFVDQVYQPDPLTVVLAFTGRGPKRMWLFSSDARWPRAHATRLRRQNPETPPGFCMLARKHLGGAHLTAVEHVRFDRILRLTFRRGDETRVLVHEVMGRHSNLVLLDEQGLILGAVKVVPPALTRVRPILPGQLYAQPPGERPDPRTLSPSELAALLSDARKPEDITRALSGWGTFAAREAFRRAELSGGSQTVADAVIEMMEAVRAGGFDPSVFEDDAGNPRGVWAFASVQEGWTRAHRVETISAACDEYFGWAESHAGVESLRGTVAASLERALKTARLQLSEAEGHLEGLDAADGMRIRGELLAAQGHGLPRGAEEAELSNWYDPEGATLRIVLDPELDARANADRYFHRYRRAMAAAEAALERIPQLTARAAELAGLREETRTSEAPRLRELLQSLKAQGLLREGEAPPVRGKSEGPEFPSGVRIKRVPVRGWEILYGENATSNDYLTTRVAKPSDLWLHARAITGCHVVIRGVGSLDRLPPDILREAARLAAAHSEAKHSGIVAVDYTFRRYVRKPRGSVPGAVTYTGERTYHVETSGNQR